MFWRTPIRCPYCLGPTVDKVSKRCQNKKCKALLDSDYVNNYSDHPAFFVPLLGKPGVGKTVYLQTLMITLRQISRLWENAHAVAAEGDTLNYIRESKKMYDAGNIPSMTQMGEHQVFTMYLRNINPWKDLTLVLRDLSGEYYDELTFPTEVTMFLSRQPVLCMMLSLPEVLENRYDIDELLNNYLHTQGSWKDGRLAKQPRDMVVILSQADDVEPQLDERIHNYLYGDTVWREMQKNTFPVNSEQFTERYCQTMEKTSTDIRLWLHHQLSPVTSLAQNSQINLHFSIISSLGHPLSNGRLSQRLHPYRVLDPLIWALKLGGKNTLKR